MHGDQGKGKFDPNAESCGEFYRNRRYGNGCALFDRFERFVLTDKQETEDYLYLL
jgi:hypothetical protein